MSKIVSSKSEIDFQQWDELVVKSNTASFFQTRACYDFYSTLSFLKPFVYAVSEDNKLVGLICGYIIADGTIFKQFFSRRAIVPGGVLLDTTISSTALRELLNFVAKDLKQKAIYLEIRNYNDYSSYRSTFEIAGFSYKAHLNFHVSTPDVETALKQLNRTKRRYVKLSLKENVELKESTEIDELTGFYEILQHLYKIKVKTSLFPFEFFEKLLQLPEGKLFVVKHQGQIVGGSVCVLLPNKCVYEWFVCGMDGQLKNIFPSTFATWASIEYAAKNGYKRFDMMGAGKPEDNYGVREFKAEFGGELVEHGRFLYICKPRLYSFGKYIIEKLKSKK